MQHHNVLQLQERLSQAKAAYTTRRINLGIATTVLDQDITPRAGDVVLARVEKLGHHRRLELICGRRSSLFVGDEVIVAYGNRYAPDQFEALVPETLEPCDLVAAGGIASSMLTRHNRIRTPTHLTPIGLLGDGMGHPINLDHYALPPSDLRSARPLTLAVVGTSMNAGKTTTAAHLIKGLVAAGLKVGAAKITGTGAGPDVWLMVDAGACAVLDFVDAGFASTYRVPLDQLQTIAATLIGRLHQAGVEAIVLEIADGLYQEETAALLSSPQLQSTLDGLIFAANDAMGASGGIAWLRERKLPVHAISGVLTRSPLAIREAQVATGLPILTLETLRHPNILKAFRQHSSKSRSRRKSVQPVPSDLSTQLQQFSRMSGTQLSIQAA